MRSLLLILFLFAPSLAAAGNPDFAIWKSLPAGAAQAKEVEAQAGKLPEDDAWGTVYRLYFAALSDRREPMIEAAKKLRLPKSFPNAAAEPVLLEALIASGIPRLEAGLQIVSERTYEPLFALRELDRVLTREADFFNTQNDSTSANILLEARDRLRVAYLGASRNTIEKLFALSLLDRGEERDALLRAMKAIDYLRDPNALKTTLQKLGSEEAWDQIVSRLLRGDLELVQNPPVIPSDTSDKARLEITGKRDGKVYQNATAKLQGLTIQSDKLTLFSPEELRAEGNVRISGHPIFTKEIEANRATLTLETLSLRLDGRVKLLNRQRDSYLISCVAGIDGSVSEAKSLADKLDEAKAPLEKVALANEMAEWCPLSAMPPEARYFRALELLRPHLSWQAGFSNEDGMALHEMSEVLETRKIDPTSPWQPANAGEEWMWSDIPAEVHKVEETRKEGKPLQALSEKNGGYFWLLKDNADVSASIALLQSLTSDKMFQEKAARWLADIQRNNTVLTMDVSAGVESGHTAIIMLDARGAEKIRLKLYRLKTPEELAAVCSGIGEDFIFREPILELQKVAVAAMQQTEAILQAKATRVRPVIKEPPLASWELDLTKTEILSANREPNEEEDGYRWEEAPDGAYFDDRCSRSEDRLNRSYDPGLEGDSDALSTWQYARKIEIPGQYLREKGAYVLVAEANGQRIFAPLLVDPLQLIVRRCRDGIFAMVSDAKGEPIKEARFAATTKVLNPEERTDQAGAGFIRMFGAGENALVAEANGQFAIAGFGRVFEGLYFKGEYLADYGLRHASESPGEQVGHVYEDRLVAGVFSDRPTYRPGQQVQAKIILRELAEGGSRTNTAERFREEDFEASSRLTILPPGTNVPYEILDSKGREVFSGNLVPNDFGTAAIAFDLNPEAATGKYSIRLRHHAVDHLIPEAFQVLYYRRPNFEIQVTGLPKKLTSGESLSVAVSASYYFGKTLSEGKAKLRLVRSGDWKPLLEEERALDSNGSATFDLDIPEGLGGGTFLMIAEASDPSGRVVSSSFPMSGDSVHEGERLSAKVPRFWEAGTPLTFPASEEVVVEFSQSAKKHSVTPVHGKATITFDAPGWYEIVSDGEPFKVFAYRADSPAETMNEDVQNSEGGWVNLADYSNPFGWEQESPSSPFGPPVPVWALFEGNHTEVGKTLRILLHVPSHPDRVILTMEGRTIVDYFVQKITSNFQVVEIPVTDRWLPNVYLQACAMKQPGARELVEELRMLQSVEAVSMDEIVDPRWCRIDVIDPHLLPSGEELVVTVATDRPEYMPGESVEVTMSVKDKAGKPKEAELALAAVDDSVFSFGEGREGLIAAQLSGVRQERRYLNKQWRVPIPPGEVLRAMQEMAKLAQAAAALDFMASEQASQAIAEPIQLASNTLIYRPTDLLPSGEIPLPHPRQDFRETAAWFPQVRTDAKGVATSRFTLPDSLTRYRLTALGLTRETQVGSGRATILATLPISVQVFLPRFAVEQDRLLAVGLVHNSTPEPREVEITWELAGAELDAAKLTRDWKVRESDGTKWISGRVQVAANGQARVTLPLLIAKPGSAELTLSAAGEDSERRAIEITPWGRKVDFAYRSEVNSTVSIPLPQEMIFEHLDVSLSRKSQVEVVDALDGLQYLIDYPYGCVEQTMSRLMPAIVTRDAVRDSEFKLPQKVEAMLPEVISRGLTRLYNFQHTDGGWGWWEKDKTDDRMSLYVLYGLARCQAAGTNVDEKCLKQGLAWLEARMAQNTLPAELQARGWRIRALLGQADRNALRKVAESILAEGGIPVDPVTELALACQEAGAANEAIQLWERVRKVPVHSVSSLALRLTSELAFGEPLEVCYATAESLTGLRQGRTFGSTWDTSRAIDGLTKIIPLTPRPEPNSQKIWAQALWGNQTLLDTRQDTKNGIASRSIDRAGLPKDTNAPVIVTVEGGKGYNATVTASGYQRVDKMEPLGQEIRLTRNYRTLDGKPLTGPVKQGQVFAVQLTLENVSNREYLLVEDRRPAGCEYADDQIHGALAGRVAHQEFRDDRVSVFLTELDAGTYTYSYLLRAETPGLSHVLPGIAYPMYQETIRGETASDVLEIVE